METLSGGLKTPCANKWNDWVGSNHLLNTISLSSPSCYSPSVYASPRMRDAMPLLEVGIPPMGTPHHCTSGQEEKKGCDNQGSIIHCVPGSNVRVLLGNAGVVLAFVQNTKVKL